MFSDSDAVSHSISARSRTISHRSRAVSARSRTVSASLRTVVSGPVSHGESTMQLPDLNDFAYQREEETKMPTARPQRDLALVRQLVDRLRAGEDARLPMIATIKSSMASEGYENDLKLSVALDKLIDEVLIDDAPPAAPNACR
jgi:DNA-binding transcriptional regulator YbjK